MGVVGLFRMFYLYTLVLLPAPSSTTTYDSLPNSPYLPPIPRCLPSPPRPLAIHTHTYAFGSHAHLHLQPFISNHISYVIHTYIHTYIHGVYVTSSRSYTLYITQDDRCYYRGVHVRYFSI